MNETTVSRQDFDEALDRAGTKLKEGIINSLRGLNSIETEIASLVRITVSDTLKTAHSAGLQGVAVTKDIVTAAISASEEIGGGLAVSSKGVAKGIVMGVSDVGGDIIEAAKQTVQAAVTGAAEVGADSAMAGKKAADGVIEATKEVGGNVEEAAKAAVTGAIHAAAAISGTAVQALKEIAVNVIASGKDVFSTAIPKRQPAPALNSKQRPAKKPAAKKR